MPCVSGSKRAQHVHVVLTPQPTPHFQGWLACCLSALKPASCATEKMHLWTLSQPRPHVEGNSYSSPILVWVNQFRIIVSTYDVRLAQPATVQRIKHMYRRGRTGFMQAHAAWPSSRLPLQMGCTAFPHRMQALVAAAILLRCTVTPAYPAQAKLATSVPCVSIPWMHVQHPVAG